MLITSPLDCMTLIKSILSLSRFSLLILVSLSSYRFGGDFTPCEINCIPDKFDWIKFDQSELNV
jgi:hypothetical protein